jgi:hypothetical protein
MNQYRRSLVQLQQQASRWWPEELRKQVALNSPGELLIETFPQFYQCCSEAKNINELIDKFSHGDLPLHHNLKHLQVVTDFGGESLKRISINADSLFPNGFLIYQYNNSILSLQLFNSSQKFKLSNSILDLDEKGLSRTSPRNKELIVKVTKLLCFGKFATRLETAQVLNKCDFISYIGDPAKLDSYLRSRYISVSRITRGSDTNSTGQILQQLVKQKLEIKLKEYLHKISLIFNGMTQIEGQIYTSDILVKSLVTQQEIGIEVSFQVTTNSVIERKANEARSRFIAFQKAGYYVAYVIDGAGNFERQSACNKICNASHCTVAYRNTEIELLSEFIKETFKLSN